MPEILVLPVEDVRPFDTLDEGRNVVQVSWTPEGAVTLLVAVLRPLLEDVDGVPMLCSYQSQAPTELCFRRGDLVTVARGVIPR